MFAVAMWWRGTTTAGGTARCTAETDLRLEMVDARVDETNEMSG